MDDLIARLGEGCPDAESELYDLIYEDLHGQARAVLARLGPGDSLLQPTAIVSETYLRMRSGSWENGEHFAAVCGRAMRTVILDSYRRRNAGRRVPREKRVLLGMVADETHEPPHVNGDMLELLDEACAVLAKRSPSAAKLIDVRFFTGLGVTQVSELYGVPKRTMESRLAAAKAMLKQIISDLERRAS